MAPKAKADAKASKKPKVEEDESEKVEPPNKKEYEARNKEIQDKIEALQQKQAACMAQINEKSSGKEEYFFRKGELRAQIDQINDRMTQLSAQKDDVTKISDKGVMQEREMRDAVKREKSAIAYGSIDEIDDRIQEIELKLQVDTMTLAEEKKLVAEVKDLKKCKPRVSQLREREDALSKMDSSGHKKDINALNQALFQCRAEKREVVAKIKELTEARTEKMGDLSHVFDEKTKLGEDIGKLIEERKAIRQEEADAQRAYNAYLSEQRQKRSERVANERAQRQADYEQSRRQKMADALDEQPHLEDMTLIEQTISWCKSLLPNKVEEVKEEKKETKHDIPEGGALLVSKKDREEEYFFEPTKKSKKGKGPKKAADASETKAIKHNAATFRLFEQLDLEAPLTPAEIPAIMEKLQAKYDAFQAKVDDWKEQRDERKRRIIEEGIDPESVEEVKEEAAAEE